MLKLHDSDWNWCQHEDLPCEERVRGICWWKAVVVVMGIQIHSEALFYGKTCGLDLLLFITGLGWMVKSVTFQFRGCYLQIIRY